MSPLLILESLENIAERQSIYSHHFILSYAKPLRNNTLKEIQENTWG
jgi:hypothetical protein